LEGKEVRGGRQMGRLRLRLRLRKSKCCGSPEGQVKVKVKAEEGQVLLCCGLAVLQLKRLSCGSAVVRVKD